MYQLNAAHNANIDYETLPHWSFDAGGRINGGVAVMGDDVFLDTLGGDVIALSLHSGKKIWSHHFDNQVMSTPIVTRGLVVIGTGRNATQNSGAVSFAYDPNVMANRSGFWGRDGGDHVAALDAETGEVRWSYRTAGEDMPTPAAFGNALIFANGDAHVYALDPSSGHALWRDDLDGIATMASATATDAEAFVSVCSGGLARGATYALNPLGRVRWRAPYGNCDSSPTFARDRVYVSGVDGNITAFGFGGRTIVAALDARTGRAAWVYQTHGAGATQTPTVSNSPRRLLRIFPLQA